MKMQMFTVLDTKSDYYHNPFLARTKGEAIRMFADTVQDKNTLFAKHPADFVLFHLGEFDNATCDFDLFAAPVSIGKAVEFVADQGEVELREVN